MISNDVWKSVYDFTNDWGKNKQQHLLNNTVIINQWAKNHIWNSLIKLRKKTKMTHHLYVRSLANLMRQGWDQSVTKKLFMFQKNNPIERKYWEMLRVMHQNILIVEFCSKSWPVILKNLTVVDLHDKIYLKGNFRRIS